MNLAAALAAARRGELYPAVILHGADAAARREAALALARLLLCAAPPEERPCGACRHCRRIAWPGDEAPFHPDFQVLERDLKTATSVDGTKGLVASVQLSPFEARGQVFVVASAETLTPEAANALLKVLEEPPARSPRHFLLLAPSRLDLLPTLRSRSLAIYLGAAEPLADAEVGELAAGFAGAVAELAASGAAIHLLVAAGALAAAGGWEDPRAGRPWALAAAAVRRSVEHPGLPSRLRPRLLALAEELLLAPDLRVRGISVERILEGLVARHLAPGAATPSAPIL